MKTILGSRLYGNSIAAVDTHQNALQVQRVESCLLENLFFEVYNFVLEVGKRNEKQKMLFIKDDSKACFLEIIINHSVKKSKK